MTSFLFPSLGGVLIGAAASLLLLFNGRVAGISGIAAGLVPPARLDGWWRAAFVAGLVAGGVVAQALRPGAIVPPAVTAPGTIAVAGLLVGFGTRLGNGCTSGHGVCGISRGAVRSLVATATFLLTGAATVFVVRHVAFGLAQ